MKRLLLLTLLASLLVPATGHAQNAEDNKKQAQLIE